MAKRLDGQKLADSILSEIRDTLSKATRTVSLGIIQVGDDEASNVYVKHKKQDCEKCGIRCYIRHFDRKVTTNKVIRMVEEWNESPVIDGIIVQLPVPEELDAFQIIEAIDPRKDVDCLTSQNIGLLSKNRAYFNPCTPSGIVELLFANHITIAFKQCVIVGRSDIVGKPLATMMTALGATVTLCHSFTQSLPEITRQADILVSATGKPRLITANMVKSGAAVIDVGITRASDGKLYGDVDFPNASKVAGWITPVPGGVGPMTRAALMRNVVHAHAQNTRK